MTKRFLSPDGCPIDIAEAAEAYCLKKLPRTQARYFGNHYPSCGRCAPAVRMAEEFIRAIKFAATTPGVRTSRPGSLATAGTERTSPKKKPTPKKSDKRTL